MKIIMLAWCLMFGHKPVDYAEGMKNKFNATPFMFIAKDAKSNPMKSNSWNVHFCRKCGLVYYVPNKIKGSEK